jgi:hypothetical protein
MQRVEVILQFSIIAENKAQVPAWQSGDPEFSTCSDKKKISFTVSHHPILMVKNIVGAINFQQIF